MVTIQEQTTQPALAGSESLGMSDIIVRDPATLSAEIDGEVVALDVDKGVCYGLDPIGARIWAMIERPIAVEAVCAALITEYRIDAGTCERDVLDLFADLRAEGLIEVRPAPPPGG
jgi:hypothetical protein